MNIHTHTCIQQVKREGEKLLSETLPDAVVLRMARYVCLNKLTCTCLRMHTYAHMHKGRCTLLLCKAV